MRVGRVFRRTAALGGLVVLLLILAPLLFIGTQCVGTGGASRMHDIPAAAAGLPGYVRPGAATYLALPEWYVIYGIEEYAAAIEGGAPSRFPYFGAIRQFWSYYRSACVVTRNQYPFDTGVHLMLGVVGMGFSVENALKGAYEKTLGRITEWIAGHDTPEDAFAARTARECARFMRTRPWYEFPFADRLEALWTDVPLQGPHAIRKWERRVVLTVEYGSKALYGLLVRSAARVAGAGDHEIHALAENVPDRVFADARIRKVRGAGPRAYLLGLPRGEAFTEIVPGLVRQGVRFREIAGNDEIFLTVRARREWAFGLGPGRVVVAEPLLTDRGVQRVGIAAPVPALHTVLGNLQHGGAVLEHLYDY